MAVNIAGCVAVVLFYIAILIIGIVASRKTSKANSSKAALVGDRSLGAFVSIFTITATMVGGGYINGSAEYAAWNGLLMTQAPFGYCIALLIAAFFYVPKMREASYVTMFDPFQLKYGRKVGAILCIPQFLGDLFWTAAILAALGTTISIILDLDASLSIVISAAVAIFYTCLGGFYAVAYTDVIQLIFIGVGLVIAFPFALVGPSVDLSRISGTWLGEVPTDQIGTYIDTGLITMLGGIPWQSLFQRVLACNSCRTAKISTIAGSFFSLSLAIPPILMGFAASAADWNQTSYEGEIPFPDDMRSFTLPLALSYLTPTLVGVVGIGVIAAAVMSSADSSVLATSSVFTKNIYQDIFRNQATERELVWVLRISIIVAGVLGTLIAIFSTTIYGLYVLCSDLMYVCLFPQLTLILWMPSSNAYGSLTGFFVSLFLRVGGGESVLHLPPFIEYPYYDSTTKIQRFPFRTFAMLMGAVCIVVVSMLTNRLFIREIVPRKYDVLKCHLKKTAQMREINEDEDDDDRKINIGVKKDEKESYPLKDIGDEIIT